MSYANVLSWKQENTYTRDVFIVLLSSLLIALMGQLSIPLPFTPVPISFRFQTVLLLSALLGSRRAVLATALFLLQGMMGLPVFANGVSGIAGLLGPVGGYYLGYLAAAFIVGYMSDSPKNRTLGRCAMSFLVGTLIVYACGTAYLTTFVGFQKALLLGVAPFIVGDIVKTLVCLRILRQMEWQKVA